MITYDKSQGAWSFLEATEDEKAALMELAEKLWAHSLASSIARQMMAVAEQAEGIENKPAGLHLVGGTELN